MLESVSAFMAGFVKNEYELSVIFYQEPSQETLERQYRKVADYFLPGITSVLMDQYNCHRDDAWFARHEEMFKYLIPRTVYRIDEFDNEEGRPVFRCQLGQNSSQIENHPAYHFFVTSHLDHLIIAAYYHTCVFCSGSGILNNQKCPECHYGLRVMDQIGITKDFFPPAAVELHERVYRLVKNKLQHLYEQNHS